MTIEKYAQEVKKYLDYADMRLTDELIEQWGNQRIKVQELTNEILNAQ